MCKQDETTTSLKLMTLTAANRIEDEMVIGVFPHSELQSTAALEVPSRESLLRGTSLSVMKPGGNQINNAELVRRIANELDTLLGGWFSNDLTSYIQLYDDLVSQQVKENYRKGGMTIQWDKPREGFYYIAFAVPPWQVQAVGEPKNFHIVFLGFPLTQSQAMGRGGHPLVHPVGDIMPLLAQAAPNLVRRSFDDRSAEHAKNVFDTYFVNDKFIVKAGVRMRLAEGGAAFPGEHAYFYGIRINIDLREE